MNEGAELRRVVTCVGCKSENVTGNWTTRRTEWYGFCSTCGLRFWHRR